MTDDEIDKLDTFSLHHLAPRGRESVREFARAILAAAQPASQPSAEAKCNPTLTECPLCKLAVHNALLNAASGAEPVAWIVHSEPSPYITTDAPIEGEDGLRRTSLYASPVAWPEPRSAHLYPDEPREDQFAAAKYNRGWNDCLAACKAASPVERQPLPLTEDGLRIVFDELHPKASTHLHINANGGHVPGIDLLCASAQWHEFQRNARAIERALGIPAPQAPNCTRHNVACAWPDCGADCRHRAPQAGKE